MKGVKWKEKRYFFLCVRASDFFMRVIFLKVLHCIIIY
jgi:hypothetical protein